MIKFKAFEARIEGDEEARTRRLASFFNALSANPQILAATLAAAGSTEDLMEQMRSSAPVADDPTDTFLRISATMLAECDDLFLETDPATLDRMREFARDNPGMSRGERHLGLLAVIATQAAQYMPAPEAAVSPAAVLPQAA